MGTGGPFRELGRFLDDCEREDRQVTGVDIAECPGSGGALTADVDIAIHSGQSAEDGPELALTSPRVGPDGTLRFAVESAESLVASERYDIDIDPTEGSVSPDGSITVSLRATGRPAECDGADPVDEAGTRPSPRADDRGRPSHADGGGRAGTPAEGRSPGQSDDALVATPTDGAGDQRVDPVDDQIREPADGGAAEPAHSPGAKPGDARGSDSPDEQTADPAVASTVDGSTTAERDRDLPPFKDPEYLRNIFETHDTFAEMAEAIEMDVTAETVRRYMIDYDIHQPNSYQTSTTPSDTDGANGEGAGDGTTEREADGRETHQRTDDENTTDDRTTDEASDRPGPAASEVGDERSLEDHGDSRPEPQQPASARSAGGDDPPEPVVLSDGIGLPDDVTVETLIDTVKRSNTLYEVTREMDIDRESALDVLEELNLLDLVVGRLATEVERDLGREEIVERLREASATG